MINLLIPKMVFFSGCAGPTFTLFKLFSMGYGWGGVGWGFNEEQDLQQALVLGRCLVM